MLLSYSKKVTHGRAGGYFFFQAEDGIRDGRVTGVQTCALPICECHRLSRDRPRPAAPRGRDRDPRDPRRDQIGRASCRERVQISVVAVSLKKKTSTERCVRWCCLSVVRTSYVAWTNAVRCWVVT